MKKRIVLAASAAVITVGSVFAFSGSNSSTAAAQRFAAHCPPECCNGNGNECEVSCEGEESSCCMMMTRE